MKNKIYSFGRVLKELVKKNKLVLVIFGIYYTAILAGGELARSVIISSIEHGPYNVGSDVGLYNRKKFLLDMIPILQVILALMPLMREGVYYYHRKSAGQN